MQECKLACLRVIMILAIASGCTAATIGGTVAAVQGEPRLPLHI